MFYRICWVFFIILCLIFLVQKNYVTQQFADIPFSLPPAIDNTWHLTFDDEFQGTTVNHLWQDGGVNWGSGGNGEQQGYMMNECSVVNGLLQIQGERKQVTTTVDGQAPKTHSYSSCMINTIGTFSQTYGYFAFKGKIPHGQGFWPAFWLYDASYASANEIDVMENLGDDTTTYYMTYHTPSGDQQQHTYHGVDLSQDYHTYAVKWTPSTITFYLDDIAQYSTPNQFSGKMMLLINLAIGGNWPGNPNAQTIFPGFFDVDYVRVWAMPGDTRNPIVQPTVSPVTPSTSITLIPSLHMTPQPITPTPTLKKTTVAIKVCLQNITCQKNFSHNPHHLIRPITVVFTHNNTQQMIPANGTLQYNQSSQSFQGTISLTHIPSGVYTATIRMTGYLPEQLPNAFTLINGTNTSLPLVTLIGGDINHDNTIDILDYNDLLSCFGSKLHTASCFTPIEQDTTGADMNDDGVVDGVDYNLFLRDFTSAK